jgi:hypothetical protein
LPVDSFFKDLGYEINDNKRLGRDVYEEMADEIRNMKLPALVADLRYGGELLTADIIMIYVNDPTKADMTLHELCSMLFEMGKSGEIRAIARRHLSIIMSLGNSERTGVSKTVGRFKRISKPRELYKYVAAVVPQEIVEGGLKRPREGDDSSVARTRSRWY